MRGQINNSLNRNMSKESINFSSLKKLLVLCKPFVFMIIFSIILAIVHTITQIIAPDYISNIVDIIQKGLSTSIDLNELLKVSLTIIVIYVIGSVAGYIQQFLMATVTQKTSKNLRTSINLKINKLPLSYFDKISTGDLISIVSNDIDTIAQALSQSIANLISNIVLLFGVLFMMFKTNWILAITTILTSIVGFFLMFFIMSKSQKHFFRKQVDLGDLNGQIEEIYSNQSIVKAYNGQNKAEMKFLKTNNKLYEDDWKSQFLSGIMQPIMSFSGNLAYVMVFIVGVSLSLQANSMVSLGVISGFIIYANLFSQPLTSIAQSMTSLQQASAASTRLFNLLEEKELTNEENNNQFVENIKGNVDFEHVNFAYEEEKPIIKDFSVSLKAGQKVAIVGPTGAGKTTMVNLLMKFYDVSNGDIKIDGVSIKNMKRETIHDMFDMILQDTWLFNGTVRENLVYNKNDVDDRKLDEVIRAVGLESFIKNLPHGYDTYLDNATSISEGQKQQLTIARAMIKDSPLLILDEATSNVDTRTELIIQKAMDELTKNRTSFVIAHRLSTIKNADVILVMKNGDIIEQGNHEQLLKANGFYAELYNSQFEKEN